MTNPVFELRVAVTSKDYERLVKFYCEGLGIEPAALWNNNGGRALILDMGKATLELFDEKQAEVIDQLEAGQRLSGAIRFALQVPDLCFLSVIGRMRTPPCASALRSGSVRDLRAG